MFVSKKSLEDDFKSLDEKIEDIHSIITEEIQNTTSLMDNNIKWLNSSITIYRTQINDLEDRICLLEECETSLPNSDKAVKISEIYDKISINERKVADLRSRLTEHRSNSEDWQDKITIFINEVDTRILNIEQASQSLKEGFENQKAEINSLTTYQQEIIENNADLNLQVGELQNQVRECNQKLLIQDDTINRMQELIKKMYKEILMLNEGKTKTRSLNLTAEPEIQEPKFEEPKATEISNSEQVINEVKKDLDTKTQPDNESPKAENTEEPIVNISNTKLSASEATEKFIIDELPSRIIFGKNENSETIERKIKELSNFENIADCINSLDNSSKSRYNRCMNNYKNKLIDAMSKIDLENTEKENISSVVSETFFKVISSNIIDVFMPLIYTIIKNGRGENKEMHCELLKEINIYLEKCCIYNKRIDFEEIPTKRTLEMMNVNKTFNRNPELTHHISEIKALPYCLNYIGADGKKAVLLKKGIMSIYKG